MERMCYLIDDEQTVLLSMEMLLNQHGIQTKSFVNAREALAELTENPVGCVVTDIRMADMSGLEFIEAARLANYEGAIIVVTGHADLNLAITCLKLGAEDLLEKPFPPDALVESVRSCLSIQSRLARNASIVRAHQAHLSKLSPREMEVVRAITRGSKNKQIAHELQISVRTVEVYRANAMMKTGCQTVAELVRRTLLADL